MAAALREHHGQPGERVTFTHVPVATDPSDALALARSSSLNALLVPDGALLNSPTSDYYVPVEPVRADPAALVAVGVTASTWAPPAWDFKAAELTVRFVYAASEVSKANQELRLYSAAGKPPSLSRWTYDQQRAESGYEGERPLNAALDDGQVHDMLTLVQRLTGEPADRG